MTQAPFFARICDQYFYSSEWLTFTVCILMSFALSFWFYNSFLIFIEYHDIPWIDKYRIQKRKPKLRFQPDIIRQMKEGLFKTQSRVTLFLPFVYFLLNINGKIDIRTPIPSWFTIIWQIGFCVLTDDFVVFWIHYLLHTRWLYVRIHKKHHAFKQPTGIVGIISDPWETFFQSQLGIWLTFFLLKEKHIFTVCLWIWIRTYEAVNGHSGYELPYLNMHYYVPWLGLSPSQHDYHHEHGKMNYGSFLAIWDRLMGTHILPKCE